MSEYKVIFLDFDNTICLHRHPVDYASPVALFEDSLQASRKLFSSSVINWELVDVLCNLRENNDVIIGMLSSSGSIQLEIKKVWLKTAVPRLKLDFVYGVSVDCTKKQFILSFQKYHSIQPSECILIDDDPGTVNDLYRSGVCDTCIPEMFIMEYSKSL